MVTREELLWLMGHPCWYEPKFGPFHLRGIPELGLEASTVPYIWDGGFAECVSFWPVFVNPANETMEDDRTKNTAFRVWVEAGPPGTHDIGLDLGAPTMPEALDKLRALVLESYGDYDPAQEDHREVWHKTHECGALNNKQEKRT